eukprot:2138614-Lingulodinium_polyedra.AAC.1
MPDLLTLKLAWVCGFSSSTVATAQLWHCSAVAPMVASAIRGRAAGTAHCYHQDAAADYTINS